VNEAQSRVLKQGGGRQCRHSKNARMAEQLVQQASTQEQKKEMSSPA